MRGALAPVAWLKEDASQMVNVARKRLPTEQEQRKAKKQAVITRKLFEQYTCTKVP